MEGNKSEKGKGGREMEGNEREQNEGVKGGMKGEEKENRKREWEINNERIIEIIKEETE